MVARSLDTADGRVQGVRRVAGPGTRADEDDMRYRFDVVSRERGRRGVLRRWLVVRSRDGRLGCHRPGRQPRRPSAHSHPRCRHAGSRDRACVPGAERPHPHALAVSLELIGSDSRIRKWCAGRPRSRHHRGDAVGRPVADRARSHCRQRRTPAQCGSAGVQGSSPCAHLNFRHWPWAPSRHFAAA